ncbi:peptidoglycan-binding protein [Candidatus Giovannonibacteria bacterium]|nr:peptidoglycan-binding protein [Candidatus Giovannonibacteria bacterium]
MTCYATGGGGTVTKSVTVKVVDLSADVSITSNKSSLSDSQISSILSLLQSFGTEQSIINNVENSLRGKVTSTTSKPPFAGSPNLPADVDHESTYSCADLKNDLRYRARDASTSGEVSLLQDFLQAKGYLKSDPTGYFGLLTFQAVKDLQKLNEISPTGFVGPITRAKIKSLSCVIGL